MIEGDRILCQAFGEIKKKTIKTPTMDLVIGAHL
jgi:hypothetical protein